jgi:hypothetical protein
VFLSTSDKYTNLLLFRGKASIVLQLEQMSALKELTSRSLIASSSQGNGV